jgi:hypothetical protein
MSVTQIRCVFLHFGRSHFMWLDGSKSVQSLPCCFLCARSPKTSCFAESNAAQANQLTAAQRTFVSEKQGYKLDLPGEWQDKSKAGADALFEDPQQPSTSVGVTVAPVRVSSIEQFGDLNAVSTRLLAEEKKKVSVPFKACLCTTGDFVYICCKGRCPSQHIQGRTVASAGEHTKSGATQARNSRARQWCAALRV